MSISNVIQAVEVLLELDNNPVLTNDLSLVDLLSIKEIGIFVLIVMMWEELEKEIV